MDEDSDAELEVPVVDEALESVRIQIGVRAWYVGTSLMLCSCRSLRQRCANTADILSTLQYWLTDGV